MIYSCTLLIQAAILDCVPSFSKISCFLQIPIIGFYIGSTSQYHDIFISTFVSEIGYQWSVDQLWQKCEDSYIVHIFEHTDTDGQFKRGNLFSIYVFLTSVVHCCALVWLVCLEWGRASDVRSRLGDALPPPCVQTSELQPPLTLWLRWIWLSFSVQCQGKENQHWSWQKFISLWLTKIQAYTRIIDNLIIMFNCVESVSGLCL